MTLCACWRQAAPASYLVHSLTCCRGRLPLRRTRPVLQAPAPAADFTPNLFLTITPENEVVITVQRSEMGQGVRTALAMCLADELDADWASVRIEQAPGSAKYGDQTTGGSVSISGNADLFRAMGASARNVLIHAAAAQWDVDASCLHY